MLFLETINLVYLPAVIILLLCISALYLWLLPKPLPGIPCNPHATKSLWGDVPDLMSDPEGLNIWAGKQLAKLKAPICQAFMGPLSKPIILLADFGDARDILVGRTDFDRSSYIADRFPLFGGFHLRMKTGSAWKHSRQWLQDLMTPRFLHDVAAPGIYSEVLQLLQLWESKAHLAAGRPLRVGADLKYVTIDVMLAFMFGEDFQDSAHSQQIQYLAQVDQHKLASGPHNQVIFPHIPLHPFIEGICQVGDVITSIYATPWSPKIVSWWMRYMSRYKKFFDAKEKFIGACIFNSVQRLTKNEIKTGVDHMVMREEKAALKIGRQPVFGSQTMIDEIYGELIAGEHTTSAALVWTLKFLTDYPQVQTRLREELQAAFGGVTEGNQLPSLSEIINSNIPYLDAVIEETLRLRAAFLVPRDAVRDTELLGHSIPKNTVVLLVTQGPDFSSSSCYADKAIMEVPGIGSKDLGSFDPERWLVTKDTGIAFDGSTHPQLAFGLGPRACWGRRLALLEMRIAISLLLWKFDFLEIPQSLSSHLGVYDISYRAQQDFVRLSVR